MNALSPPRRRPVSVVEQYNDDDDESLGVTALHVAAEDGADEEVRRLVERGHDPCALDCDGRSPVSLAITNARPRALVLLLSSPYCTPDRLGADEPGPFGSPSLRELAALVPCPAVQAHFDRLCPRQETPAV